MCRQPRFPTLTALLFVLILLLYFADTAIAQNASPFFGFGLEGGVVQTVTDPSPSQITNDQSYSSGGGSFLLGVRNEVGPSIALSFNALSFGESYEKENPEEWNGSTIGVRVGYAYHRLNLWGEISAGSLSEYEPSCGYERFDAISHDIVIPSFGLGLMLYNGDSAKLELYGSVKDIHVTDGVESYESISDRMYARSLGLTFTLLPSESSGSGSTYNFYMLDCGDCVFHSVRLIGHIGSVLGRVAFRALASR